MYLSDSAFKKTLECDMEIIVLGKYSNAGLSGFAKNPNEDRKAVISAMTQKAGGKLHDLWLTRGHYDVAVHAEVPDFESIAAVKMMIMASGAMDEMEILEVSDFNAIGAKAAEMMTGAGAYKAPGS